MVNDERHNQLTDEELLQRLAENLDKNFEALFKKYGTPLYRYAYRIAQNEEDARDVIQIVLLNVYSYLRTHSPTAIVALSPFLFRVTRNATIDVLGDKPKLLRQPRNVEEWDETFLYDPELNPEKIFQDEESYNRIVNVIYNLKETYREVAIRYFLEDQSMPEIANELQENHNTINSRIRRVRPLIRKALEEK